MTRCNAQARQHADHLAAVLERDERVLGAAVVPASEDPTDRWLVDCKLRQRCSAFPVDVLDGIDYAVGVRHVGRNCDYPTVLLQV